MNLLFKIGFGTPQIAIANTVIIAFILIGIYSGYKKGFIQSFIRFIGSVIALIGAYALKNPLSVFMYTHLPFFKLTGFFKGVTAVNIIIYELIAFLIVFSILMVIINIIVKITGIVDKFIKYIFLIDIPNKILGAILGFFESIVVLYFICFIFSFVTNFMGFEIQPSLVDDINKIPVLSETFGNSFESLNDIAALAKDYESVNDKDEYNRQALEILMKYDIITCENVEELIDKGKIEVINQEELMDNICKEKKSND